MIQVSNKGGPKLGSVLAVPAEKAVGHGVSVRAHCLKMELQILQVVGGKITIQADQLETETTSSSLRCSSPSSAIFYK